MNLFKTIFLNLHLLSIIEANFDKLYEKYGHELINFKQEIYFNHSLSDNTKNNNLEISLSFKEIS